jgi:hypothetical protein
MTRMRCKLYMNTRHATTQVSCRDIVNWRRVQITDLRPLESAPVLGHPNVEKAHPIASE